MLVIEIECGWAVAGDMIFHFSREG